MLREKFGATPQVSVEERKIDEEEERSEKTFKKEEEILRGGSENKGHPH